MEHLEILKFFDGMAYGVSQIQKRTLSFFCGILLHNSFFDLHALQNHGLQSLNFPVLNLKHLIDAPFIIGSVFDQTMFQHLAHTAGELLCRKSLECGKVGINQGGMMESSHHILVTVEIHAGFSADAAVHLGQQSGGGSG